MIPAVIVLVAIIGVTVGVIIGGLLASAGRTDAWKGGYDVGFHDGQRRRSHPRCLLEDRPVL